MKRKTALHVSFWCIGGVSGAFGWVSTSLHPISASTNPSCAHQQATTRAKHSLAAKRRQRSYENEDIGIQDDFDVYNDDDDWGAESFDHRFDGQEKESNRRTNAHIREPPKEVSEHSHFFSRKSLQDFSEPSGGGNPDNFFNLCRGAGISKPSKIQALAWPRLMEGKHAIVADQTGSGKTLAYLIPLLQKALAQPRIKAPATPRVLILSPTAELADQTRAVCDKLAFGAKFKTMVVTANGKYATSIRDQIRLLQRTNVDVLISTPGRLATILRTKHAGLDLSQLSSLVLDEVDVLLVDETFGPQLRAVGAAAPVDQTQFVFVTATLPNHIVQQVEQEFPGVVSIRGPGLHRVAPTVQERLVDVSVPPRHNRDADYCFDVKAQQLLKALRETRCRRTLVFCNTVETCRKVENLLKRQDRRGRVLEVIAYHNALTPEARNENLTLFSKGRGGGGGGGAGRETTDYVLVCTDRAARGVDFEAAPVDHVLIFDFPKDPAEYVRRVGRTARAGRGGTSTVFAFGWQLPIARKVMGKTLETLGSERETDNTLGQDEENSEEYSNQKRKRNRKKKSGIKRLKDNMVKGNIEEKRMWR